MVTLSRKDLFDAVWTRPLSELAPQYGLSDVGLRKICDRFEIPTPGRGYWAKVRAGMVFPRPKLRPASSPHLDIVKFAAGPTLPTAVAAAMQQAKALQAPAAPPSQAPEVTKGETPVQDVSEPPTPTPTPTSVSASRPDIVKALLPTQRALEKGREDSDGFLAVRGRAAVRMAIARTSGPIALEFLEKLLAAGASRGWRLEPGDEAAHLVVEGETIAFKIDEIPHKTPHTPTPQEQRRKTERDRWGGDSQPWPTWDLSPSGRLAFIIQENDWSGLRRTFSQRRGYTFNDALESVVVGLAGHAAYKIERRRKAEEQARAAAIAEARRKRLAAYQKREDRRGRFVALIADQLAERSRLEAVLAHLEGLPEDDRQRLANIEAWVRRKLKTIEARLGGASLYGSARASKVSFGEPPPEEQSPYWYGPEIELRLWRPDPEADLLRAEDELDWLITEGLVEDPRAATDPPQDAP